jgi:ABC-type transport system involved in multi-copper enzyme maturation permease subunit
MKGIGPVITTSIRNNLRSRNLIILFVGLAVMIVVALTLIFSLCEIGPELDKASPDKSHLELYLGLIMYLACLFGVGISINVFAVPSMTKEKTRGVIESLLATPLKPKGIWLAKSLAVFLPGLVLGWIFTIIALIAINYVYIVPEMGFVITPWIVVTTFVMLPLMYFCVSLLVHLVGLTGAPQSGNTIAQFFLPIVTALVIILTTNGVLDITSGYFTLINLGIAAVIGIVIASLHSRLTKERIVLSRRG